MHERLTKQILAIAEKLPKGTPVVAKNYLHLGNRAAVDQALSRLAKRGQLSRAGHGIYIIPYLRRVGNSLPRVEKTIKALAIQRGEAIVSNGAAAAKRLGLASKVPDNMVFLTSGRNRKLIIDEHVVEFRQAPRWQLTLADRPAGEVVRALGHLGPEAAKGALKKLQRKLPRSTFKELAAAAPQLPTWLALIVVRAAYG